MDLPPEDAASFLFMISTVKYSGACPSLGTYPPHLKAGLPRNWISVAAFRVRSGRCREQSAIAVFADSVACYHAQTHTPVVSKTDLTR